MCPHWHDQYVTMETILYPPHYSFCCLCIYLACSQATPNLDFYYTDTEKPGNGLGTALRDSTKRQHLAEQVPSFVSSAFSLCLLQRVACARVK